MFKDNKYTRCYYAIIKNTCNKSNTILEKHHILPKSLGGTNQHSNIVEVTLREHYVLHKLLPKMVSDNVSKSKMLYALHLLSRRLETKNSRHFEIARQALSEANKLRIVTEETRNKISIKAKERGKTGTEAATKAAQLANKGRVHNEDMKKKLSLSLTGRKLTKNHKDAIGNAAKGRKMSVENKAKLIERLDSNHHNRYEWILIDPSNNLIRTHKAIQFCLENNLSYTTLRYKAQTGDSRPISRGPSAGWIVFAVKKLKLK